MGDLGDCGTTVYWSLLFDSFLVNSQFFIQTREQSVIFFKNVYISKSNF